MTDAIYPFRPPRTPAGPRGAEPVTPRAPRVDPPVRPIPAPVAPGVASPNATSGAPTSLAAPSDPRSQALAQLLGRAEKYGDRGDSTQTITDLLNAVDMGGAGRATASWQLSNDGLRSIGDNYQSALAAALAAQRAKIGSGGGGGGSGGGAATLLGPAPSGMPTWLDDYLKALDGRRPAPSYKPTVVQTATGDGYGASQHPVAPRKALPKFRKAYS